MTWSLSTTVAEETSPLEIASRICEVFTDVYRFAAEEICPKKVTAKIPSTIQKSGPLVNRRMLFGGVGKFDFRAGFFSAISLFLFVNVLC
jgi:hypothetical protein